ncbi:23349_t:CDS:2 [Entrophospora sp. SA101]|nr:23349_t:CDS:2 [Entrophospora sp. SA101]
MVTAKRKSLKKNNNNAITNDDKNKLIAEEFKSSDSEQSVTTTSPTTTPRTRSRQTPTRTSPRKIPRDVAVRYGIYDLVSVLFEYDDMCDGTESINGSNAENIFYNDEPSYREPKGKAVVQTSTTTSESNHSHNKNSLVDRDDDDDGISPSVDIKKKKTQLQSTNRVHHCSVPTDNDVDASSSKDIRDETAETKTLKRKRDDIEIKSKSSINF